MSVLSKILRAGEGKKVRALTSIVPDINAFEPEVKALSDDALRHKTVEFKERFANGEDLNDLLIEAFAVTREAAWRVIGQRHFDVQLMGGAALHFGWIAEMKTGEGKTLVSTLPAYLNALSGQGMHIVTVNDYLASRDSEWMGRIHKFLGLNVGLLLADGLHDRMTRKAAYAADITYGTNAQFGFDYLLDNMARSRDTMAQRGHVYAIIDEVDSILIDEARTPLIISGPAQESAKLYAQFSAIARTLTRDDDYEVDEEKRTVAPTEAGIAKVESSLGVGNMYDAVSVNYVHQLTQALRAKELYKRDKEYVVMDGEVKIVDETTGRIMEGRRWSDGLHQAVEAKENVFVKDEDHTWATVTLQNYFRLYDKLSGMTGTAETEASEFANTYSLPVVPIPTHRPMVRTDQPDVIYATEQAKFNAAVEDLMERHDRGQPVLVGTASVEKSEVLSRLLDRRGVPHTVLNAKQHFREAEIVAQAGRLHAITVATNMAGRGVDILLGGNPEGLAHREVQAAGLDPETEEGLARYGELLPKFEEQCKAEGDKVRELGGLYVLGSERHESRRIDNQLRGRSGRQGDFGESRFYLSMEDDLIRIFATGAVQWLMSKAMPDDEPIDMKMISKAVERAQNTVEQRNAEIRKDVLKYDEVLDAQRKVMYKRRMQVIDGDDLRDETMEILDSAIEETVVEYCQTDYPEDWDLPGLLRTVTEYFPTKFTVEELGQAAVRTELTDSLKAEAIAYYEQREAQVTEAFGRDDVMRDVEREVMLQIIDARWREHLQEMDYLRDGINLRAMGQKDPLVEWQREGYEMFGQLMGAIANDYLRYVMHVDVVPQAPPQAPQIEGEVVLAPAEGTEAPVAPAPAAPLPATPIAPAAPTGLEQASFIAPDESPSGRDAIRAAAAAEAAANPDVGQAGDGVDQSMAAAALDAPQAPIVKSDAERIGRNDPCHCGSGRKFKHCHGA
ncbi:MAG TPA: preprotein translocase subunit SecA [Acidimicrobiales bacterium]|nr:preprotein translocase subunit SecA [Acidimicrobiales bacterium]